VPFKREGSLWIAWICELKDTLSKLVNVYFFETSILFKVASVSAPAIISLMKTIDKLPSKEEFTEIKSEAQSQYSRIREGLEIIKAALDDRTARDKKRRGYLWIMTTM
jgi:hypothetical protein